MSRALRLALLCAGALAALAALGCTRERPPAASSGGTLVVATLVDLQGVNELLSSDNRFTGEILELLFPVCSSSCPISSPGRRASPRARRAGSARKMAGDPPAPSGLVWSDGEPLTAADVLAFTFEAQTPEVAWSYAHAKGGIESVEVLDDRTVRFRFREPYATQLLDANEGGILPRHVWGERPFASWREDADWFRDHLVVRTVPARRLAAGAGGGARAQPALLGAGAPGSTGCLPRRAGPGRSSRSCSAAASTSSWVVPPPGRRRSPPTPGSALPLLEPAVRYIVWNTRRPLLPTPRAPGADLAIDRQELVDALWFGYARPALSLLLEQLGVPPRLEPWPYDPPAARRLRRGRLGGARRRPGEGTANGSPSTC